MSNPNTRLRPWLLAGCLLSGLGTQAQQTPPAPERLPTFSLKLGLSALLSRSYQLSAEKVLGAARRHSVVLTPQLYSGQISTFTSRLSQDGDDRVRGYGLAAQHRVYLDARTRPQAGLYIGYGVQYQHFQLDYMANSWSLEQDANGLSYYQFDLRQQRTLIDRYGAAAGLGWQAFLPGTPAFLDVYMGFGYRHAKRRATVDEGQYTKNSLDYGHSGTYTPLAIRIGVALEAMFCLDATGRLVAGTVCAVPFNDEAPGCVSSLNGCSERASQKPMPRRKPWLSFEPCWKAV